MRTLKDGEANIPLLGMVTCEGLEKGEQSLGTTHSINPTETPAHNPYNFHPSPNAVPNASGSATT